MPKVLLLSFAILACGVPAALACEGQARIAFDKPAVLEGVLKSGKGTHEAQGEFSYVYVELDKPVCVDAPPAAEANNEDAVQSIEAPVTRVQLAGEAVGTDLPIGKHVAVEGTLFAAHTMWHAEEALIDASEVKQR
jgi:hypothetical protein